MTPPAARLIRNVVPRVHCAHAAERKRPEVPLRWPDSDWPLTNLTDEETRRSAFLNGADSFITKRDITTRLLAAIKDAAPGGLSPGAPLQS